MVRLAVAKTWCVAGIFPQLYLGQKVAVCGRGLQKCALPTWVYGTSTGGLLLVLETFEGLRGRRRNAYLTLRPRVHRNEVLFEIDSSCRSEFALIFASNYCSAAVPTLHYAAAVKILQVFFPSLYRTELSLPSY